MFGLTLLGELTDRLARLRGGERREGAVERSEGAVFEVEIHYMCLVSTDF